MLEITPEIRVPLRELAFEFTTSGGPGGQHANRNATRAVLRWSLRRSQALPGDVRERLLARHGRRINDRGELVLASRRFRSQGRNVADCIEKLKALVAEAAAPPRPRRPTRPSRAARERRLADKRRRSETKQRRRAVEEEV